MSDRTHPARRRRAVPAIAIMLGLAVLAGCYSTEPLPPGQVTHTFYTQHPTEGACEVKPPRPIRNCCAVQELPNGRVKELPIRQGRNGYLFDTYTTATRQSGLYPIVHQEWYENGWTNEIYVPACLSQRDVKHYINQGPQYRKWRRTVNLDQGAAGLTIFYGVVESGSGHRNW